MKRLPYFLIALFLIGADRALKAWISHSALTAGSRPLLGQVIRLTPVHNVGGALGILPGSGILFIIVSLVASIVIVVLLALHHYPSRLMNIGLALVLAGAIGNLIDRLAYGYVFDYLEVRGLFVNNLADVCVSVGVGLIILRILLGGERDRAEG